MICDKISLLIRCALICVLAMACEDYETANSGDSDRNIRASVIGTYQAEDHTFQSGCRTMTKKNGYTGSGYMDYGGQDSLVEWTNVKVSSTGHYTLVFRYANGSGGDRSCQVTVNDANVGNVAFKETGRWRNWESTSITAKLKAGENKIRVAATTSSGGPNLDRMDVEAANEGGNTTGSCAEAFEFESTTISCPNGKIIGSILFASYGLPEGSCENGLTIGRCHSQSSKSEVEASCLGRKSCTVAAENDIFGDPCPGNGKKLAVTYSCVSGNGDDGGDDDDNGGGGGGNDTTDNCAYADEFEKADLSCPRGQVISSIDFASYGTPEGSCDKGFSQGKCHDSTSPNIVKKSCLNRQSCSVVANNATFDDPCVGWAKSLAITYTCQAGDPIDENSYQGTGKPLPLAQYMLGECNPDEQKILKTEGFTKFAYVSVGKWTKIGTIQGSPLLPQWLLDSVAREFKLALEPIIERYPDRMRKLLDINKGTINVVMVWGAGPWGVSGFMGDDGMFFKRNAASDGGFFHELGHVFDIHDNAPGFRQHVDSVLAAEDAAVLDKYCLKDDRFINDNGTCQYSEFVAEKYREMMYPEWRKELKKNFPEIYDALLKYIPTPSSYVPFPDYQYLE